MVVERILKANVDNNLKAGKVAVIYGARRVGKTFLIKQLLKEQNEPYLWFNGEDVQTIEQFSVRSEGHFRRIIGEKKLLVIDEAQAIPDIGKALKLLVDTFADIRIVVSGSSAFELRNQIGEPLVGRAFWYQLYPFSQVELKSCENFTETIDKREERLIYGSYPEVYTSTTLAFKEDYLFELVNAYLLKDILAYEGIKNSTKIYDLLKLIAFQVGKEVSMLELGNNLGMSKNTVEKYLDILEKAFVIKRLVAFSKNLRKEISKSSRFYFWDNGIRNALIGNFNPLTLRNDVGELWENYIVTERLKRNAYLKNRVDSYFWRTYDQQEIDYLEVKNIEIATFEIKYKKGNTKFPVAFEAAYPNATFDVINQENYLDFIE